MTAQNAFARDEGAYLLADAGVYDGEGRVLWFSSKVVTNERLLMAISFSGAIEENARRDLHEWLESQATISEALSTLPEALRQLHRHAVEVEDSRGLEMGVRLAVIWWDHWHECGRAAVISSTNALAGGNRAFELRPLTSMFSPPLPAGMWPKHSFKPADQAAQLADMQRELADAAGIYRVGGAFELVAVTSSGIARQCVREWPEDRVGFPILPKAGSPTERSKSWKKLTRNLRSLSKQALRLLLPWQRSSSPPRPTTAL